MRSAKDDMAICDKATPGPWAVKTNAHKATRGGSWGWIKGPRENWCWADERPRSRRDADFVATAREALPYWIERAAAAEKKIASLTADLYERDLAMRNEGEATRSMEIETEKMERALERACKYIDDMLDDCPHRQRCEKGCGSDSEIIACWKRYFLEGADKDDDH